MDNPRRYDFNCGSWFWGATKRKFKLADKDTVIVAKTVVHKDKDGKIQCWNPITEKQGAYKGSLYIVAEDTIAGDENVICLVYAQVLESAIILANGLAWIFKTIDGEDVFDSLYYRSKIILV